MVELDNESMTADVLTLRQMVLERREKLLADKQDDFHPRDVERLKNDDKWVADFLENHEYNVKSAFKQFIDTLEWRRDYGVNEIREEDLRQEYLLNNNVLLHGRDLDGKLMIVFLCKDHTRGTKDLEDLKKIMIYWIERGFRESNYDKLTLMFDMAETGLKNVEMDYTQWIINTFKSYYPNSLNWILVYEMPWIMNGIFQIIKKLLPKRAVDVLKFINKKSIRDYIDEENMLTAWGGKDDYKFTFVSEKSKLDEQINANGYTNNSTATSLSTNNNSIAQANLNFSSQRKVHFANNLSESPSPLSDLSNSSSFENRNDMLQLSPAETIVFQRSSTNELTGNVHILNVSKKAVTYKVKTTAPDKFRVRPSSGTLSPMTSANINVVIQKGQQLLPVNKDKFLVMCMALPDGEPLTADEIANMWKEVTANSPEVEQHRLKCTVPAHITTAIINNVDTITDTFADPGLMGLATSSISHNGTKQSMHTPHSSSHHQPINQQHLNATINQLSETVHHLNQQVKSQQSLQWITIFVFVMISVAIVYILKIEIQTANSQYCIDK